MLHSNYSPLIIRQHHVNVVVLKLTFNIIKSRLEPLGDPHVTSEQITSLRRSPQQPMRLIRGINALAQPSYQ